MKLARFVIAAIVVGVSAPAFAQAGNGQQAAANPPATQANPPATQAGATSSNQVIVVDETVAPRGWMASGYVGSNFSSSRSGTIDLNLSRIEDLDSNNSTSINFGGQVGYVARGRFGGEYLLDFSPGLGIFNNALFAQAPDVTSNMFNLIGIAPFGHARTYDPYLSGGIGWVSMSSTIFTLNPTVLPNVKVVSTEDVNGTRFGWNLGGGFMAWSERNWGFRADVRYYATTSGSSTEVFDIDNIGDGSVFSRVVLSGISFWKVNAGMSFRW